MFMLTKFNSANLVREQSSAAVDVECAGGKRVSTRGPDSSDRRSEVGSRGEKRAAAGARKEAAVPGGG